MSDVDKYDETADACVLMTIHSAKGLEFPVVFLIGMEEGIFPGIQSLNDPAEMSEERRLAYVAITRAKEKIYITHVRERMLYGRTAYNQLSRFVRAEIPQELIAEEQKAKPKREFAPVKKARPVISEEFFRRADITRTETAPPKKTGLQKLAAGTRVRHSAFGEGVILSVRDMGGDFLYEVQFEGGVTKRLMATFAKLQVL